jgi:cytochrome c-type biogenesis protein CcmH
MMAIFWLLALLLLAGVLLLILPPLLRQRAASAGASRDAMNAAVYRDQLRELEADVASGTLSREGYEEARGEIERRLLEDVEGARGDARSADAPAWRAAIAIGVPLPVAALALYFFVGSPQVLLQGGPGAAGQTAHSVSPEQIRAMVDRLAARMEKEPDDLEGWIMLGRSYMMLEQFREAARAYANAVERAGPNANLLADYADALAMAQGRSLAGEPEKILQRALAIDPHNPKALALTGTAAFERKDYAAAIGYWERILEGVPPESEIAKSVQESIAEAKALSAQAGAALAQPKPQVPAAGGKSAAASVSGVVELAPALAGKVGPDDVLFVYARAAEGPRMPLAILRTRAKDLPLSFTLDDSSAMAPGMTLSSQRRVVVEARVSRSGNATRQPGDLEGSSTPVEVGTAAVTVVIQSEVR